MTHKVLSPMVARRRGRPCTKRKVSKVDEIVNRLKGKNKRASKVQGRKLNFASMDGMQASPCIDGTQESMYVPAQGSPMQMVDNIGSGSVSHSQMVTNISSQSGPIGSKFIELNIDSSEFFSMNAFPLYWLLNLIHIAHPGALRLD
ncbi:hypothetical protein CsSME_00053541 [Camellia sinensis var. sinensis]